MLPCLAADRALLLGFDVEIANVHKTLDSLVAKRAKVQARLSAYAYPVQSLPDEVVSEIFLNYIPPYPICPALFGNGSPTTLTQICALWRQIAHKTPGLWRAIEVLVVSNKAYTAARQLTELATWAQRSRSLPLSVLVGEPSHDEYLTSALGVLLPHRERLEYLGIDYLAFPLRDTKIEIEGIFPALRILDVRAPGSSPVGRLIGPLVTPRLTTALLDLCDALQLNWFLELLPWAQLTRLWLRFVTPRDAARILPLAPNLESCRVIFPRVNSDEPPPPDVPQALVKLPILRALLVATVDTSTKEEAYRFLLALRLPALKRFYITDSEDEWNNAGHVPLRRMIQSFGCELDELHVEATDEAIKLYRVALPSIPTIEALEHEGKDCNGGWGDKSWDLFELHGSQQN
ncbi:F-box domain-containing protein [Mycena chlorophos]|uniref:F-box domain-containing protein n=1 Tax=Mycena chlorophos TaxID=658473 RepID=A0A8H6TT75_MYCCL|nr:F-box domain-containing protein [Mycena chlorophos]